jgi:hypothetical protein
MFEHLWFPCPAQANDADLTIAAGNGGVIKLRHAPHKKFLPPPPALTCIGCTSLCSSTNTLLITPPRSPRIPRREYGGNGNGAPVDTTVGALLQTITTLAEQVEMLKTEMVSNGDRPMLKPVLKRQAEQR